MAERVAEVHMKAPNGRPISDEAAALAASTLAADSVGWRGCFSGFSARSFPIHRWSTDRAPDFQQGIEPFPASRGGIYCVRAIEVNTPKFSNREFAQVRS